MARKRMIDPEFWLDEELAQLSAEARLLYIGSWSFCDDNYATFPNRPLWIKAQVFPYNDVKIEPLIRELVKSGKFIDFESEGKPYIHIKNFFKYQRIDKPSSPKYPKAPGVLQESSKSTRSEVKRREEKRSKENTTTSGSFEVFWDSYPKKEEKKKAKEIWLRKKLDPRLEEIKAFVEKAKLTDRWQRGYIKQPTAFLNGECWNDDLTAYGAKKEEKDIFLRCGKYIFYNADEVAEAVKKELIYWDKTKYQPTV